MQKKIFYSLEKILKRLTLSEAVMPLDLNQWQDFLSRINNSFYDFEQERYLLERSMEISSREFVELNQRFEIAESISNMGHWFYYPIEDRILFSKETFKIFGIDFLRSITGLNDFYKLVYEEDKEKLTDLVMRAITEGIPYECEYRFYDQKTNEIRYVNSKVMPMSIQNRESTSGKFKYNLSGMVVDITDKKESEKKLREMNAQLIALSREAGISEVATSTLHNVGNILNSVNVSVAIMQEIVSESEIKNFNRLIEMIQTHLSDIGNYLSTDEKGKLIPDYLQVFSEIFQKEHSKILEELSRLYQHVEHIKSVINTQNSLTGALGIKEKIMLSQLCDMAIQMSFHRTEDNPFQIVKNYHYDASIFVEKTKLLQILVNLLKNAQDAVREQLKNKTDLIRIVINTSKKSGFFDIIIEDNGVGIPPENLIKIFSFGFTTKLNGHGFGLHSSAIAAKEMGGTLFAKSEGPSKGAQFILTLPCNGE